MIEMVATTTLCTTPSTISSGKGIITTQKLHRKAVVLALLQLLEPKVQILVHFNQHYYPMYAHGSTLFAQLSVLPASMH
jgi:hypothetical protein